MIPFPPIPLQEGGQPFSNGNGPLPPLDADGLLPPLDGAQVGAQSLAPERRSRVEKPTTEKIVELVKKFEDNHSALHARMEEDYALATLEEYDAGDGYRSYTSNEPMTYLQKVTSVLAAASLKVKIPIGQGRRDDRERQDGKERFLIGILAANDERLMYLGQPSLLDTLVGFVALRGWYCGRALLVKDLEDDGKTYADITAFDPLHFSWSMGSKGLKWACFKSMRTVDEIEAEYGMKVAKKVGDDKQGIEVYDWYDEDWNAVVIDGQFAKKPTVHTDGLRGRVPVFFGAVGHLPLVWGREGGRKDNLRHWGESIFAANRGIYESVNLIMSTILHLVALSRNASYTITSRDGSKTLDSNPFFEGSEIPLAEGERIDLLALAKMSQDTGAFLGLISGEIQRGALPYSVYGQLAFQLSGYAVNLLKQATDSPIVPRKQAVDNALKQIGALISDQYASGSFDSMALSGMGKNREWFEETFTPDMIRDLPVAQISLVLKTPQDDVQRMAMAIQARQLVGGVPTAPDRWIWDNIMEIEDTDHMADAIKEQMGERLLPGALLYQIGEAMMRLGREDLAEMYARAAVQSETAREQPDLGRPGGAPGGVRPEVLPGPVQGIPSPQPTPQQGPIGPPGPP